MSYFLFLKIENLFLWKLRNYIEKKNKIVLFQYFANIFINIENTILKTNIFQYKVNRNIFN